MARYDFRIGHLEAKNVAMGDGAQAGDRGVSQTQPGVDERRWVDTGRVSVRVGFAVDAAGYSGRPVDAKEEVQRRIARLVDHLAASLQVSIAPRSRQDSGDGVMVFLPPELEIHRVLPVLMRECAGWLRRDNERYRDRLRLRFAIVVGPVGVAPLGFTGDTAIECSRLIESEPVRSALADHPDADLAVIISDHLHAFVVREGHPGTELPYRKVRVRVKDFEASAWLWVGSSMS
jgi:hypothetical protein